MHINRCNVTVQIESEGSRCLHALNLESPQQTLHRMTQCVAGFGVAGVGFEQTFMAGVASHFPIAFEAVFIDRQSHSHNVSGDLFGFY